MKYAALSVALILLAGASYVVGYAGGFRQGSENGYVQGQVELSLDIERKLGNTVDRTTIDDSYSHFMDVHDITIYIHDVGGTKTLAFWKYRRP